MDKGGTVMSVRGEKGYPPVDSKMFLLEQSSYLR